LAEKLHAMFNPKVLNGEFKEGHRGAAIDNALYKIHEERMQKIQE